MNEQRKNKHVPTQGIQGDVQKKGRKMGGFEKQVKERAKEMKHYLNKGAKVVGESCKKGWLKLKNIRSG
ncbi:hypothetical protein DCAR_0418100 [Daucus carota subsp. sativus]|uniref:Uncharacterized protein n=1 Tax=Daucus carota subsp. sativus TaxID=79200 RepID=A0A165Z5H9_DAUCS|nr:hypothetical protein DCAR_0418100 [Daucus carota subsp. sativus]